jgi:hypothetical protein
MTAINGRARIALRLGAAVLAVALLIQIAFLVSGSVGRVVERAWIVRRAPALERSAQIAFGSDFSDFISFIRETVPESAKLVVPSKGLDPVYGDIGLMQYFLRPRTIIDCPLGEGLVPCVRSLTGASTYILAVPDFPPQADAHLYRNLVAFRDDRGVYVPKSLPIQRSEPSHDQQRTTPYATAGILILDLTMVAGIGVLGSLLTRAVLKDPDPVLSAAASLPIGIACLTWVLFLLSWFGVRLNLWTAMVAVLVLAAVFIFLRRIQRGARRDVGSAGETTIDQAVAGRPAALGWVVCSSIVGLALLVSVLRSYSTWDDMGAYAIRGYGIAREGSVAASQSWGPVAASYPLNVPLAISMFHFLDGDILPGSKLLFPFFLGAILLVGYRLWRRAGCTDAWAAALTLTLGTIPVVLDHSTTGYTNLPFSAYLALGCALILEGSADNGWRKQLLGGLFLAGAIWTRPEGLLIVCGLVPVLLIAIARIGLGRACPAAILLPPALVSLGWLVYGVRAGAGGQMPGTLKALIDSLANGALHLDAPYWTLRYLGRSLIDPSIWGLLLPLGLLLLVFGVASRGVSRQPLSLGLLAASAAVGAAIFIFYYLVSFSGDLEFWLGTGVERMFLPAGVLAWLGLGALSAQAGAATLQKT